MKAKFLLQYLTELMIHGDINDNTTLEVIEGDGSPHGMAREIYEQDFDPEKNRVEIYPVALKRVHPLDERLQD